MNLGENLKKLRKDNNLSQEDLADKLNVSRQSVSKWESGLAYPEMDKVLQICKLFNVNIDDIMNEDISEIKENKESKNKFNIYINNFFDFITKTVKMIYSMTFKEKLKLFIEEIILIIILNVFGLLIHEIFMMVINNIFLIHSNKIINTITYFINNLFDSLSTIIILFLMSAIFIHIFKIRYLNYFHLVDNEDFDTLNEQNENLEEGKQKILIKDNKKIIIRDPSDSKSNIINLFSKAIKFFLKIFSSFILFFIILSIIFDSAFIVVSFKLMKNIMLFIGIILCLLSTLTVLLLISNILFNFIINRKSKLKIIGIFFAISFIILGVGMGLSFISSLNFERVNFKDDVIKETKYTYKMSDDLYISGNEERKKYIVEDRDDILIKVKTHKNASVYSYEIESSNPHISVEVYTENTIEDFKNLLNDLNTGKFYDYSYYELEIYANEENINKLKENY